MKGNYLIGNWKMTLSIEEQKELIRHLAKDSETDEELNLIVCPSDILLEDATKSLDNGIEVGAQNASFHSLGAHTGDLAMEFLLEIGCQYVILGHSERREFHNETDEDVRAKVEKALELGLTPIICVGETAEQKDSGRMEKVLTRQIEAIFEDLEIEKDQEILLAYEPVWAIGSGNSCTSQDLEKSIDFIEGVLGVHKNQVNVLYGGSVKPENITSFLEIEKVQGFLVGGASTKIEEWQKMQELYLEFLS